MNDDFDPSTVAWVFDKAALANLLGAIEACEEVVIDLETTGLNEHATGRQPADWPCRAQIVLASLTLPHEGDDVERPPTTWAVPLAHPDSPWLGKWRQVMRAIAQTILRFEKPVVNQNMKFDARWIFAHTGADLSHLIAWDTQSGSHLIDETSSTKLKVRAPEVFGVPRWDDFDLSTPGAALRVPLFDLGLYAARDTYWTWRLAVLQRRVMLLHQETRDLEPEAADEIEAARLGKLATWCAMPMVATLTAVEQRGMRLDVDWVSQQLEEYERGAAGLKEELAGRYAGWHELPDGEPSFAPASHWFLAWAKAAVDAGDLRVTAFTGTGRPQWNKGVLLRQARRGAQVAQDLLDYRGAAKKAEYLRSWLNLATPGGFIHTTYNCARVITGRLSSDSPNMQQVTAALKPAYVPGRPGHVVIDFDYSQIELRIAAFISRCPVMIEAFQRGDDLHKMLALRILQLGEDIAARRENRPAGQLTLGDVTAVARQAGKSANFGLLYLMGSSGFQQYAETVYDIAFTVEEAQLVHRAFYEQWAGIGPWHQRTIARARTTGQVVSPIGRVRRLPDIRDGNPGRAAYAERAAVNAPVQGFGSDVMQIAAGLIEGTIPGSRPVKGACLIGTVHDSILVEAPEDHWQEITEECIDRMRNVHWVLEKMGCEMDVPLEVEAKAGSRWGLSDIGMVKG